MKMNPEKLNIPHVQQPEKSAMCGASCLEMAYTYLGRKMSQHDIWPEIRSFEPITNRDNCRTYLMGKHAQKQGFKSLVVSCNKPLELIECCLSEEIVPIVLCHTDPTSKYGHYCVVTGISYKGVTVNDPLDPPTKANKLIKIMDFILSLRSGGEVSIGQTMLLISKPNVSSVFVERKHIVKSNNPSETDAICMEHYDLFCAIQSFDLRILCLQHDKWCSDS